MIAYVYCTNNKYNLRKCISFLKIRKIKYTIFDEYFAAEKRIDDFNGSYYVKFIGTANVRKFKNNDIVRAKEVKKCLSNYGCFFNRFRTRFILRVAKKTYIFKRNKKDDIIFDKFFVKKEKDFFEFSYNEANYNERNMIEKETHCIEENDASKKSPDAFDDELDEFETEPESDEFDNEALHFKNEFDDLKEVKSIMSLEQYEDTLEKDKIEKFDVESYFKYMTKNQIIILALWLIGLSNKAISLLLKSSPTYVCLEKQRIMKKMKNITNGVNNAVK